MHRYAQWGLLVVFGLIGLAGCAPATPPRATVNIIGDKFSKSVTLNGIPLHDPTNGVDLFWMLRSFVDQQTHVTEHQIYVEWTYAGHSSGKYFATDDKARPLPVTAIFKDSCPFGSCNRVDTLGIGIDEATLKARTATGFQVKLSAQDGTSGILDITPQMISAQLVAEQRVITGQPATIAVPNPTTPAGKPLLGIAPQDLLFGIGVMVARVDPGTPAEAAGFQTGDMLKSYNGQIITKADQLRALIEQTRPGAVVPVDVTRNGQTMTLSVQM